MSKDEDLEDMAIFIHLFIYSFIYSQPVSLVYWLPQIIFNHLHQALEELQEETTLNFSTDL